MRLEPTLSQSLHLLNGDTTAQKIQAGNLIGRRLAEKKDAGGDHRGTVHPLPEPQADGEGEGAASTALLAAETDKKKALDDVFWALLNSREFMFNH